MFFSNVLHILQGLLKQVPAAVFSTVVGTLQLRKRNAKAVDSKERNHVKKIVPRWYAKYKLLHLACCDMIEPLEDKILMI
mgnify:FL=1